MPSFSPFKSRSALMILFSLLISSTVIFPYFFKTPLLISALTFWICAPLGNILKKIILNVSTNPSLALNKSENCMGFNMGVAKVCGKSPIAQDKMVAWN
jgi:hypothetical protein